MSPKDQPKPSAGSPIWRDKVFIGFLTASLIGVVLQITMGGAVRVTGSGDGCPDWPLCFGRVLPPLEYHALMEYTHRTIGVVVGLAIIGAAIRVLMKHRRDLPVVSTVTAGLIGVTVTGGIGGVVVLSELSPAWRTLHLMLAESVALALVIAMVATFYRASDGEDGAVARYLVWWAAAGAALTLIALLSGSYAVWRGAGPICASWPLCGGSLIPQHELIWIHMTHRVTALAAAVPSLIVAHIVMKPGRLPAGAEHARMLGLAAVTMIAAQILLGAANPWTGFAQWARVAHLTVGTLQWVVMSALLLSLIMPRFRGEAEQPANADDSGDVTRADALSGAVNSGGAR